MKKKTKKISLDGAIGELLGYTGDTAELTEALLRVEMSNLYIHLAKNDYFQPGSADPTVLKQVNDEIREFASDRLQSLLGISKQEEFTSSESSSFNEDETDALKALATTILAKSGVHVKKQELKTTTPQTPKVSTQQESRVITTRERILSKSTSDDDANKKYVDNSQIDSNPGLTESQKRIIKKNQEKLKPLNGGVQNMTPAEKLKASRIPPASTGSSMVRYTEDSLSVGDSNPLSNESLIAAALRG